MAKKLIIALLGATMITGSAPTLTAQSRARPSLEETKNYVIGKCTAQSDHIGRTNGRVRIEGSRFIYEWTHRPKVNGCSAHNDIEMAFDIKNVKFRPPVDGTISPQCVRTGPGTPECIETHSIHGTDYGNRCRAEWPLSRQFSSYLKCDNPENTHRALLLLQEYLGGPIKEYQDPFVQ